MLRSLPVAALAFVLAAFTLSGCSGGGDEDSVGDPTSEAAVRSAADRFRDASFTAEYTLNAEDIGDGTVTIYKDGNTRFRFDIDATQAGEGVHLIIIEAEDSAFCLDDAGALGGIFGLDGDDGVCFESDEGGTDDPGGFSSIFTQLLDGDVEVAEIGGRQIAGRQSRCYRIQGSEADVVDEVCISDEGVFLYAKSSDGSVLEATDVSDEVDSGVFDLPYEIRDLPEAG